MPLRLSRATLTMFDIYGYPIKVNHEGSPVYSTYLGTFVTLCTYALIVFNLANLVTEYTTRSGQITSQSQTYDLYEGKNVSLSNENFQFAIFETEPISEDLGRLVMYRIDKGQSTRGNKEANYTEIPRIDCDQETQRSIQSFLKTK